MAGNLPYYITSKCLLKVLESGAPVARFTAMVQKEVADRLMAGPGNGNYGAITASVAYYGNVQLLFAVSRNCFLPAPDVDSAVIGLVPAPMQDVTREDYTRVVRGLFSQRRKTIQNNMKNALQMKAWEIEAALEKRRSRQTLGRKILAGKILQNWRISSKRIKRMQPGLHSFY